MTCMSAQARWWHIRQALARLTTQTQTIGVKCSTGVLLLWAACSHSSVNFSYFPLLRHNVFNHLNGNLQKRNDQRPLSFASVWWITGRTKSVLIKVILSGITICNELCMHPRKIYENLVNPRRNKASVENAYRQCERQVEGTEHWSASLLELLNRKSRDLHTTLLNDTYVFKFVTMTLTLTFKENIFEFGCRLGHIV